ncbi:uncharacterized protein STEHIDRAFT_152850 [Stereum hirsutum FP-91666 SS1]|uniref:uncharacterized protein n=1 Tax=Stereum hirsutum (strain FP-91666) TaxID=721885 RepID=UPI000440C754|nr:uncharacterized protein STEHIDRAFT_152850 [Stereum hirsutum FP-91666 SS1]EIM91191.1 hypothetical protein STEHIDRAFT_152850 [Stereum hirsutum FP-91666 SS1]
MTDAAMDVDNEQNVAGPSSQPKPARPTYIPPSLYLPPPREPRPPLFLNSSQDLVGRFRLQSAYDKFVKPFIEPTQPQQQQQSRQDGQSSNHPPTPAPPFNAPTPDVNINGKGKAKAAAAAAAEPATPMPATPGPGGGGGGGGQDGDEEEVGKDGKKKKNTYRHLIKGIPGDYSLLRSSPFSSRSRSKCFALPITY